MDVHAKLAEVRELVVTARSMPMSSSAVVHRGELLEKLDELADALAQAFKDSASVLADREAVVEEGRRHAAMILEDARSEQERLVSDSEVYRVAQTRAHRVLEDAKLEAEALRSETDEYVDGKLASFEITLEKTLDAVRRGRDRLAGQTVMDTLTAEEADKIVLPDHLEAD